MSILKNLQLNKGAFGHVAEEGHGYITFPKLKGPLGSRMQFNGKEKVIWSLNDYLGLATHPEVVQIDRESATHYSMAFPMGSRIMSGNLDEHELLEQRLAEFTGKESAMLFNFGYPGIVSSLDAILSRRDVVIYDQECHACIIDGVRLHRGKHFSFKHNDLQNLEEQLVKAKAITSKTGGGILVVSEGVFSMRGDQGKLKEIVSLKPKYDFNLFVDDAHGFGVLGKTGAGTGEEQHVQDEIDFYFSTFAKTMASFGAFLAAKEHVIKYLYYNTRSQVFSKSLPMITTLGAIKRLELLRNNTQLRNKMWKNARKLRKGLVDLGLEIGTGKSPITPVYLNGSMEIAKNILIDLRETYHIFCSGVIYPVVPKGVILFRLVVTARHSDDDINQTVQAFKQVVRKLKMGSYEAIIAQSTI